MAGLSTMRRGARKASILVLALSHPAGVAAQESPAQASLGASWSRPLFDRTLSASERRAPLPPEFDDAIMRIEGIHDPTRVGLFGPALRMQVRAGTASMTDVFGDRWLLRDNDPNVHYRVRFLARAWLFAGERTCDEFRRFRTEDGTVALDRLSTADCARLQRGNKAGWADMYPRVATAPLTLPLFAAPYPGGRLSAVDLRAAQEARVRALREKLLLMSPRAPNRS